MSEGFRLGRYDLASDDDNLTLSVLVCTETLDQAQRLQTVVQNLLLAFGYDAPIHQVEFAGSHFIKSEFPRKAEKLGQALSSLFEPEKECVAQVTPVQKAAWEQVDKTLTELRAEQADGERALIEKIKSLESSVERLKDKQEQSQDKISELQEDLLESRAKMKYANAKIWATFGTVLLFPLLTTVLHKPVEEHHDNCNDAHVVCIRMSGDAHKATREAQADPEEVKRQIEKMVDLYVESLSPER